MTETSGRAPARRPRPAAAVVLALLLPFASASVPVRPSVMPDRLVAVARAIQAGHARPGWEGGAIPYSWGGGHGERPGPSLGTCRGYRGSIRPCPAAGTLGLDCSGLARWVYHLAYGRDVLGPGNTDDHLRRLTRVPAAHARPGDLVFYGEVSRRRVRTHHVGIYVGQGMMINALRTGTEVRTDPVTRIEDFAGYFRYL
ncbi:C40 family peptidase [Planomonospora sp. ID91781]|uniref:C40 family peptidase n=1 Tax=Planomonospora sp. ID91781 TaxID=2738135 RepID=UPI0018C38595|nr:NlpC/P60 family protein [Planomonospora sp. ID91781]MBG0821879.1 C40 family peptidase [Planomonospora sp. ID91781]